MAAGVVGGEASALELVLPSEEAACVWAAGLNCALTAVF